VVILVAAPLPVFPAIAIVLSGLALYRAPNDLPGKSPTLVRPVFSRRQAGHPTKCPCKTCLRRKPRSKGYLCKGQFAGRYSAIALSRRIRLT
jgi:hypothetical protein